MVIPQLRTSRQRSQFIRKTHRRLKREVQRDLELLFGKTDRERRLLIPARKWTRPSELEASMYW